MPVTVAAPSKTLTVSARSNAGIPGSNPTQGRMSELCAFILWVGKRPCEGLIPRPRSPTDCV
jgi:hypothetical protein